MQCNVYSAMCIVNCALYNVHSAMCIILCAMCNVYSTISIVMCKVRCGQYNVHRAKCIVNSQCSQCQLDRSVKRISYTAQLKRAVLLFFNFGQFPYMKIGLSVCTQLQLPSPTKALFLLSLPLGEVYRLSSLLETIKSITLTQLSLIRAHAKIKIVEKQDTHFARTNFPDV